jgi:hypothetical protein
VIAWREFDETVAAATDDAAGGAAAAHQATGRVLAALAAFCAAQPSTQPPRGRASAAAR